VDESKGPVDRWKGEMSTLDHPRSELDDLFRRKGLLHHKAANYRGADTERNSGLLHGDPESLVWGWARRKALGVANMLHALLRPGVIGAGAITQPVQDRDDGAIFTDLSELTNQRRYFFGVDVVVIARPVLTYRQFGLRAAGPVQLEMNCRRVVRGVGDDLLQDSAQDALLQRDRRAGIIP
jgi:hypothetical protein